MEKINEMPLWIKYRPKSLGEFIGNEEVKKSLDSLLKRKDRPHAYLFTGNSGCGKTTMARIIKNVLGCSDIDFFEYNTANTRGIDTVREIIENCKFYPWNGRVRVYLLDEIQRQTIDAQNALLKILEDTPEHVYFILCTTEPEKLIEPIKTRCTTFKLMPLRRSEMRKLLLDVCKKEKVTIDEDVIEEIIKNSKGSPRKGLVLLESVIGMSDKEAMLEVVREGGVEEASIVEICRLLLKSTNNKWDTMKEIIKRLDKDPEQIRYTLLGYMGKVLLNSKGSKADKVAEIMSLFQEPFHYTGRGGLIYNLYLACKVI